MPCQQAPKNSPPANAKGGPFDTEAECKENIGKEGGCPCCSDGECGSQICCNGKCAVTCCDLCGPDEDCTSDFISGPMGYDQIFCGPNSPDKSPDCRCVEIGEPEGGLDGGGFTWKVRACCKRP
jgi:hypothetical protein